jgi:hypothetical protein
MGNPFKDFKDYPTTMKIGFLAGMSLLAFCILWPVVGLLMNAWVPKPIKWDEEVLQVDLCGPTVEFMEEAAEYVPGCEFEFNEIGEGFCDFGGETRIVVAYGDPTRGGQSNAGAYVSHHMRDIEGWYFAGDRGDGWPGWVPVGTASGARMVLREGEKDARKVGHELHHVCGRWHVFKAHWMKRWGIYENLHVLSPATKTMGNSLEGLSEENGTAYYEPFLTDVEGKEKPEDP